VVGETLQQVVYRAIQTELNPGCSFKRWCETGRWSIWRRKKRQRWTPRSGPDAIQIARTSELWKERSQRRWLSRMTANTLVRKLAGC